MISISESQKRKITELYKLPKEEQHKLFNSIESELLTTPLPMGNKPIKLDIFMETEEYAIELEPSPRS